MNKFIINFFNYRTIRNKIWTLTLLKHLGAPSSLLMASMLLIFLFFCVFCFLSCSSFFCELYSIFTSVSGLSILDLPHYLIECLCLQQAVFITSKKKNQGKEYFEFLVLFTKSAKKKRDKKLFLKIQLTIWDNQSFSFLIYLTI